MVAITVPFRFPLGRGVDVNVGDTTGVKVEVGVAVCAGNVAVKVGVAVSTGMDEVAVGLVVTGVKEVAVGEAPGVNEVAVGETTGVWEAEVAVAVTGVSDVAVGETTGVNVAVGPVPVTVMLVPVDAISVKILSPFETRASHSIGEVPASKPVTLNVKAEPLVVALFPLLPAMAKMKLPFCGPLSAVTGSAPNRLVATGVPTLTKLGL